jgi:hypothetical protein
MASPRRQALAPSPGAKPRRQAHEAALGLVVSAGPLPARFTGFRIRLAPGPATAWPQQKAGSGGAFASW